MSSFLQTSDLPPSFSTLVTWGTGRSESFAPECPRAASRNACVQGTEHAPRPLSRHTSSLTLSVCLSGSFSPEAAFGKKRRAYNSFPPSGQPCSPNKHTCSLKYPKCILVSQDPGHSPQAVPTASGLGKARPVWEVKADALEHLASPQPGGRCVRTGQGHPITPCPGVSGAHVCVCAHACVNAMCGFTSRAGPWVLGCRRDPEQLRHCEGPPHPRRSLQLPGFL